MEKSIEYSIERFNKLKIELLKIAQCIEQCNDEDKEFYLNVTEEFSRKLKDVRKSLEKEYGLKICRCNK